MQTNLLDQLQNEKTGNTELLLEKYIQYFYHGPGYIC